MSRAICGTSDNAAVTSGASTFTRGPSGRERCGRSARGECRDVRLRITVPEVRPQLIGGAPAADQAGELVRLGDDRRGRGSGPTEPLVDAGPQLQRREPDAGEPVSYTHLRAHETDS